MKLLIPGPVTTDPRVRAAMAQDIAPWDNEVRAFFAELRARIRAIAGGTPETHATLPLQGSGHFAVEAALRSFLPPGGRILIPATGAYAERMTRLARDCGRVVVSLAVPDDMPVSPAAIVAALDADPSLSHVGIVYSETGSGVIHDAPAIGAAIHAAGRRMILDAVSAFGALPLDLSAQPEIDVAVFTSNKCLEGLPGMSFSVARIDRALACAGNAGSWSLDFCDLYAQALKYGSGSFRFTPPIQVVAALKVALDLFDAEGGRPARLARYRANADTLHQGMRTIGLSPCLPAARQGPIVLNVHAPADPAWSLQGFVDLLKAEGFLISNFYNTHEPSFRVGCIGAIAPDDMRDFTGAVDASLIQLGVRHRGPAAMTKVA